MKNVLLMLVLIASACSTEKKEREPENKNDPKAFLLSNFQNQPLWDVSSELRCDALKGFFEQFAKEALNGSLDNYDCKDQSIHKDYYQLKLQFTVDGKTAVIETLIGEGNSVTEPKYCTLPFESDKSCKGKPYFFENGNITEAKEGLINSNLQVFSEFVRQYLDQQQNRDLAFGIEAKEFAKIWTTNLETNPLFLTKGDAEYEVSIQLVPEIDAISGKAKIVSVTKNGNGQFFFMNCLNEECAVAQEYKYLFNGHYLVLSRPVENGGTLYNSFPLSLTE